jgi:aminoglycoside phosphotransferase (APT) family kinase protein
MPDGRIRISDAIARRLVDEQFPRLAGLPISMVSPQGWDNTTFRLGSAFKLRFPTAVRYAAQATKEAAWLPRLAPHLPFDVPTVVGLGVAGHGFPMPWSVQDWLPGEPAAAAVLSDPIAFAREVAAALSALQRAPVAGGPAAGDHSFHRGGDLAVYDGETRACLAALGARVDHRAALAAWEAALAARWTGPPVWVHGDIAPGNLLVRDGALAGVIDFGCVAVGDPACDLVIAWTFLDGPARPAFREAAPADAAMWTRARGWALWKALLTLTQPGLPQAETARARAIVEATAVERG